jgi:hypothetical protein
MGRASIAYVIVYQVVEADLIILSVFHGKQRRA